DYVKHAYSAHDNRVPKGPRTLSFQTHLVIIIAKNFDPIVITIKGLLRVSLPPRTPPSSISAESTTERSYPLADFFGMKRTVKTAIDKLLIYFTTSKRGEFDVVRYISDADSPLGKPLPGSSFCLKKIDAEEWHYLTCVILELTKSTGTDIAEMSASKQIG